MNYRALFDAPNDFLRSTRIDLDTNTSGGGFVVTPMFARALGKILAGLDGTGPRAITITGPYGSGKSTTVLEVLRLIDSRDEERLRGLRERFNELDSVTNIPNSIIIPVVGAPGLIAPAVLGALVRWVTSHNDKKLLKQIIDTDTRDLDAIIGVLDIFRAKYHEYSLVLVIDELGKHLEYAVSNPDDNDVYLLQLLAEYADRSNLPTMSFITILHQAFDNYGHRLLRSQRDELTKIQGRFEDIPFQLPIEDTIKIVGAAVSSTRLDSSELEPAAELAATIGEQLYNMGAVRSSTITKDEYLQLCRQCAPLHPMTVLLMGPLFRHFAQNERSLFSMLCSFEPHGFQQFLDDAEFISGSPKLYSLPELYEYVMTTIGSSVFSSTLAHRWRIIENNLGRVPEDRQLERDIIRTIGLIAAIPVNQLVASGPAIALATQAVIDEPIEFLTDRSLIVHRKFSNSFRLWDGSDIDIEAEIDTARQTIGVPTLVESLAQLTPPRPITARRHLMQTGALRWFETQYVSSESIDSIRSDVGPGQADGRVYFVVASAEDKIPSTFEGLQPWQVVIWIALPSTFVETIAELRYVRWVKENTSALIDDEVARREVAERENNLEQLIQRMVSGNIFRPEGEVTFFTHRGAAERIGGNRMNSLVSDLCDELYLQAPHIINEFVNRNTLSSAATAARNEVLKRMLDCSDQEALGITGFPPALPIYLSTLRETGLHRYVGDSWTLSAPELSSPWFHVWRELEEFTSTSYQPVSVIWEALSRPPFGMRKGLLPILTVAFLCVHRGRASIMEDGEFLPELTSDKIDLFLRAPEKFRIHLTEISGSRKAFLEALVNKQVVPNVEWDTTVNLLSLVSPLVRFGRRLPEYSRNTQSVSETAMKIRKAVLNAKEPSDFLFNDLPLAAGSDPIASDSTFSIEGLANTIVVALQELHNSYERLQHEVRIIIFEAFGYEGVPPEKALQGLRRRAALVQSVVQNLEVKAIAWRMSQDTELGNWIESVASVIMKKPPKSWLDRELEDFRLKIFLVEREFVHYETIASLYSSESGEVSPVRVGITALDMDFETVVTVSEHQQQRLRPIVEDVMHKYMSGSIVGNELLFIAAELVKAYYNNSPAKEESLHV